MGRLLCALSLAAALCLTPLHAPKDSALGLALSNNELIRIHVIARSDEPADQAVKLKVRDAVLASFGTAFSKETYEAASRAIEENLAAIEQTARETARAEGFDGSVEASFGLCDFPTRVYGGETVPAGTYPALRIVLGGGGGRNWWCVLYPSLCLIEDGSDAAADTAQPLGEGAPDEPVHWTSILKRIFCGEDESI